MTNNFLSSAWIFPLEFALEEPTAHVMSILECLTGNSNVNISKPNSSPILYLFQSSLSQLTSTSILQSLKSETLEYFFTPSVSSPSFQSLHDHHLGLTVLWLFPGSIQLPSSESDLSILVSSSYRKYSTLKWYSGNWRCNYWTIGWFSSFFWSSALVFLFLICFLLLLLLFFWPGSFYEQNGFIPVFKQ